MVMNRARKCLKIDLDLETTAENPVCYEATENMIFISMVKVSIPLR